jgi:hypothetical protein
MDKKSQENMVTILIGPFGLLGERTMTAAQFNRYQSKHARVRAKRVTDAKKSTRNLLRTLWSGSPKKKKGKGKKRKNIGFGIYWE